MKNLLKTPYSAHKNHIMKNKKSLIKKLIFTLAFLGTISFSQNNYTLSGYILDESSEEVIIGANVIIPELNTGTISNSYGFYSITNKK